MRATIKKTHLLCIFKLKSNGDPNSPESRGTSDAAAGPAAALQETSVKAPPYHPNRTDLSEGLLSHPAPALCHAPQLLRPV